MKVPNSVPLFQGRGYRQRRKRGGLALFSFVVILVMLAGYAPGVGAAALPSAAASAAVVQAPQLVARQAATGAAPNATLGQGGIEDLITIDNTTSGNIYDNSCGAYYVQRYFLVTSHIQVSDIKLGLNVTHGRRGEVVAQLTSPNGTVVNIINSSTDTNTNYDILLQTTGGPLNDGNTDNTGTPYYDRTVGVADLANFVGEDAFGGWNVYVCDSSSTNSGGGDFNRAQLQITGTAIPVTPPQHKQGPAIYETYFIPWPEDQFWTALNTIFVGGRAQATGDDEACSNGSTYDSNPAQPIIDYTAITIGEQNTVIVYDQWEDGYEAAVGFPTQVTTQVWGDGDLTNGVAPKDADDILSVGQVLILDSVMNSATLQAVVDYDGRDKISSSQPIAVSRSLWANGSRTLAAHADEVYPTSFWGTEYRIPVGEDEPDAIHEMFQYTGVSVMAMLDGTVVSIDRDNNGTADMTCNLSQGQACQWDDSNTSPVNNVIGNGLRVGSHITSNVGHPIQVNLLTGDVCAFFETRSFPLWPVDKWATSYYSPVGTLITAGGVMNDYAPTYVHLYNPNASAITVNYDFATGSTSSVSVPAGGGTWVQMNDLTGAHFYSAASATRNVRDEFTTQSYSRQDGSASWTTSWDETGDDDSPTAGSIQVRSSVSALGLNFQSSSAVGDTIERQANLSGATAATLSFDYSNGGNLESGDQARVQISSNGGSTWTTLTTINANTSGSYSTSIAGYVASNTRVRFVIYARSGDSYSAEYFYIDNVDITYTLSSGGDPQKFYAVATVDSEDSEQDAGPPSRRNDTYDWGITLVPEKLMTQWLIVGWAPGDDPTYKGTTGAQDTAPIWLTGGHPTGSSTPSASFDVCVDIGGNGGSLTDPITGRTYDRKITGMTPRSLQKVYYDTTPGAGEDQTATQMWVCTSGSDAILTAAWGEDPLTASGGSPAMDMGDTIRNNSRWRVTKSVAIHDDANGDGQYDEGETVRYSIVVLNTGVSVIAAGSINVLDAPPEEVTYVPNSTYVDFGSGSTQISDSTSGTPFPLDTPGYTNGSAIPIRGSMTITFDATVNAGSGGLTLCNNATGNDGVVEQGADACFPVQEARPGTIGDYVWLDEDGDGDQDEGEAGIPNVTVVLKDSTGTEIARTVTDANGGYVFTGLDAGTYTVEVLYSTLPGTLYQTYDEDDGTGPFSTRDSTVVELGSGQEHMTADFGYNWRPPTDTNNPPPGALAALGDRVWLDLDGDGIQDATELGIEGVKVNLIGPGTDGVFGTADDTVLRTTTTDANGWYIFDSLTPGAYQAQVDATNFNSGQPLNGLVQTGDPDYLGMTCPGAKRDNLTTAAVVLGPGDAFLDADFGYQPAVELNSIGDRVWLDVDRDGVQDLLEPGIGGVAVQATWYGPDGTLGTADDVIYSTVTDSGGNYLFTGLPDGSYKVTTSVASNFAVGGPLNSLFETYDATSPTTDHTSTVTNLGVGDANPASNLLQDFGYSPSDGTAPDGLIGDTVFYDANGNGRPDAGEGIPGAKVELRDPTSNSLLATTYTDANGLYQFGDLDPTKSYKVVVYPPSGLTQTVDPDGTLDNQSVPNLGAPSSDGVNDPDGLDNGINLGQDFGYVGDNPMLNTIGDRVWLDSDRDGVQDAWEPGIGSVVVQLTWYGSDGTLGTADDVVYLDVTDTNGNYLFTNLPDGNFQVTTNISSNFATGGPLAGLFETYDATTPTTDHTSTVTALGVGNPSPVSNLLQDFGYSPSDGSGNEGIIGDTVFYDVNGNDLPDSGEGIPGVKVELYNSSNVLIATTYTDANGWYQFGDLSATASYTVKVVTSTLPAGLTNTFDPDAVYDSQVVINLGATGGDGINDPDGLNNGINLGADFGYRKLWSVGNTVFFDSNSDGTYDPGQGEYGIPNVTVSLIRDVNGDRSWDPDGVDNIAGNADDEVILATDITDSQGLYLFAGLPTDDYIVWVNDTQHVLGELTQSAEPDPANDGGKPCTTCDSQYGLLVNADIVYVDFGYTALEHQPTEGLIGDTVFLDRNNNGLPDAGEGMEGVMVRLYDDGGVLLAVTYTDENGHYSFGGLAAGTYIVQVNTNTLVAGGAGLTNSVDPDGGTANQSTVTIASGGINLDQDFGYIPSTPGSIGNLVWNDVNADGNVDTGEAGIGGVTIDLYLDRNGDGVLGLGDALVGSTVTASDGSYLFGGLPAGKYLVDVSDQNGVLAGYWQSYGTPNTDNNSQVDPWHVTLASGQNYVAADFGYYEKPAALGNYVWEDWDFDGIQDAIEPGIEGVRVKLTIGYPNGDTSVVYTLTDATGHYSFGDLLLDEDYNGDGAGSEPTFTISVDTTQPRLAPFSPTRSNAPGSTQYNDSNNPAGTAAQPVKGRTDTTNDVDTIASYDFGFVKLGAIGDYVWVDEDGDGDQDAGEVGIPNVKVTLTGTDSNGNPVNKTTWTDTHGGYLFPNLLPGSYTVTVDQTTIPVNLRNQTYDEDGTGTPNTSTVALKSGEEHMTADFGYNWATPCETNTPGGSGCPNPKGAIGDRVWVDVDGDGRQDPEEPGIQGVTVKLWSDPDHNGVYDTPVGTATTDSTGWYLFDGLDAGAYVVEVVQPDGYLQTGDPDQPGVTCTDCDNRTTAPVVLEPGDVFLDADFGYQPSAVPNTIGDYVWLDADRDGVQDLWEPGIPGVLVQATWYGPDNTLGTADDVLMTRVTDADGYYLFAGVPDGTYKVTTYVGGNFSAGGPLNGLNQTYDATSPTNDHTSTVSVSGGATNLLQDFGYSPSDGAPPDGLIGDTVFWDKNGNNWPDEGEGIPGVKLELYDSGNNLVATTYTDANGIYQFGNLNPNAVYEVKVVPATLPSGLSQSYDPDGTLDNQSSAALNAPGSDGIADPDGIDNGINLGMDFGYVGDNPCPNSIGDTVWLDADMDGTQDAWEPGIPGVIVQLTYYGTDGTLGTADDVLYSTLTDVSGKYLFTGLPDGSYQVTTSTAGNFAAGGPLQGLSQTYDATGPTNDHTSTVLNLGVGNPNPESNLLQDFGYCPSTPGGDNGLIGDYIFYDANGNSLPDLGEGIPGVTVQLWDSTGTNLLATTYTDGAGYYGFGDLNPTLAYLVKVVPASLPSGLSNIYDPDGGFDSQVLVNLGAAGGDGVNDPDGTDNGINLGADLGYRDLGVIGDTVWLDSNANGVQDGGEKGIPYVTVALIRDTNANGTWDSGEPIIATDTTDGNGKYLFAGLPITDGTGTDDYIVWVNDTHNVLAGLVPTADGDDPPPPPVVTANISAVANLTAAGNLLQDFGYTPPNQDTGEGLIGDTVFLDRNNNGLPDAGEGMEGVLMALYDAKGVLVATTTTDENGNYYFGGLPAGTYTVVVNPTTLTGGGIGLTNSVDPDGGTPNQSTVTIGGTQPLINLDQDFGYVPSVVGSIGNYVWEDTDMDGVNDEPAANGIGGVTLDLYADRNGNGVLDGSDTLMGSTVTAADGSYLFGRLPAGNYLVDVSDRNGVLNGYWHSLGTPNTDNNSQVDAWYVPLAAGQNYVAADFGYYLKPAALGNFVWNDVDKDGIQDTGEPGIGNAQVTLTIQYPNGGPTVTLVTYTDGKGYYSFDNLLLDEDLDGVGSGEPTFTISVPTPVGYTGISPIHQGSDIAKDSGNPAGEAATAVKGSRDDTYDFGFYAQPTGFQLLYFRATAQGDSVLLEWEMSMQLNLLGFNLYRAESVDGPRTQLNDSLIPADLINFYYTWLDPTASQGELHYYWLEMVDVSGQGTVSDPATAMLGGYHVYLPIVTR